jgi:hypothetical protein
MQFFEHSDVVERLKVRNISFNEST